MYNWEKGYLDLIRGKHTGLVPAVIRTALHLLSYCYGFVIALRNLAYDKNWLKRRKLTHSPLIISVGNIVAGGTGKTPLTLNLAQEFSKLTDIAILSRGYRTADEAKLLAERLPAVKVIVGKDRCQGVEQAIKEGARLVLLDDGFQHRRLERDYDLVVIDARDPYGHGWLLPRGLLREPVHSLKRADMVILNHIQDTKQYELLKEQFSKFISVPIVGAELQVQSIKDFEGRDLGSLKGKKVGLFCGIARPEYFLETVKLLGADIVHTHFLCDHEAWKKGHLKTFVKECRVAGAELVICTEKDKVKLDPTQKFDLPLFWVEMDLRITEGKTLWNAFIKNIINQIHSSPTKFFVEEKTNSDKKEGIGRNFNETMA